MWKRDEAVKPPQPAIPVNPPVPQEPAAGRPDATRQQERDTVNIGKSVIIKGDLSGSEDLTIEGQVEGPSLVVVRSQQQDPQRAGYRSESRENHKGYPCQRSIQPANLVDRSGVGSAK